MSTHHASTSRQTDVRKRTVLPTTLQNLRSNDNNHNSQSGGGGGEFDTLSSDAYLDKLEEELNRKVDGEVEGLVQGLKDLIALARIDALTSHPSQSQLRSIQSSLRTQQLLRNSHNLLSMCHQLKLLHLFGDRQTRQKQTEQEQVFLQQEIQRYKDGIDKLHSTE